MGKVRKETVMFHYFCQSPIPVFNGTQFKKLMKSIGNEYFTILGDYSLKSGVFNKGINFISLTSIV